MTIFITGAAGYIGGLLAEHFAQRDDVEEVICLDKNPLTTELKNLPKILYLRANTADTTWQEVVAQRKPDVVIHCAWQIREFYFKKKLQERWNLGGSRNVFEFALGGMGSHLIYLSTVAVYGAYPDNRVDRPFTEDDPLRENEYRYGVQKKQSEEELQSMSSRVESRDSAKTGANVTVLRLASVTGPRYKQVKKGFTLQNILAFLPCIPIANPEWGRQFVQEADLVNAIERLCHPRAGGDSVCNIIPQGYHVFNIAPAPFVKAADIARKYGKAILPVPKELIRIAFFFLRHLSLGRLPTSRGGWRFYAYPLVVEGRAIVQAYGFNYGEGLLVTVK